MLKRALLDRARAWGYHHLVAKIVADNVASLEYNRRFGYTVVGTQREVGYIDGAWRDVTIMQLILAGVPEQPMAAAERGAHG
jgi:phosphinothricin acetyltransferase